MSAEQKQHSERLKEIVWQRVLHTEDAKEALALIDGLQEQLETLRIAMLHDWRMNKVDDLDYETPDGWAFTSHPWFALLGLTEEDCITMLRGGSNPASEPASEPEAS